MTGVIILDGPDGQGKTTLAEQLTRNNKGKIYHCTYRFRNDKSPMLNMFNYHMAVLRRAIRWSEQNRKLAVIDRLWMSEAAYGDVYRGGTNWKYAGRFYDRLILKHAVIQVVCTSAPDAAAERFEALSKVRDELYTENKMHKLALKYLQPWSGNYPAVPKDYLDELSAANRPDILRYDMDADGKNLDLCEMVLLQQLNAHRCSQYPPALGYYNKNILGHVKHAKWLMIGEKANAQDYRKTWPFLYYRGCSLWLTQQMFEQGIPERWYMWTNADCPETHIQALANRGLKLCALGEVASAALKQMGLTADYELPHPAYVSRWKGTDAPYELPR